ncbi:MAG: YjbF family lipoprotein [Pseudomonadota bacterium]
MTIRTPVIALMLLALMACGTAIEDDSAIGQSVAALRRDAPDFVPRFITLLQAEAPVLQVGFVDLGTNGNLLLERQDGDFAYWLSPDGGQIVLQSGMLHSTRGLGEGLLASDLSEPLPLVLGLRPGWSDRLHTYLDGEDFAITRTYRCRIDYEGPRRIDLLGRPVDTALMRESCRSLDQAFVNVYWVVPSSRTIVLSRQWAGPEIGPVSTRVVPR